MLKNLPKLILNFTKNIVLKIIEPIEKLAKALMN